MALTGAFIAKKKFKMKMAKIAGITRCHKPSDSDISKFGLLGKCVFNQLPYASMLLHFPPEYMHLYFVKGVATNMIINEIDKISKGNKKEKKELIEEINNKLATVEIHTDFGRKIRFKESQIPHLKAREIKKLVLKVLFIVLHDKMDDDSKEFWSEARLYFIKCLKMNPSAEDINYLKNNSSKLVDKYGDTYGKSKIVMKVHTIKHIPQFLEEFGTLAPYMSFEIENYLSFLKDLVYSKMGLDLPFCFASNLNFFLKCGQSILGKLVKVEDAENNSVRLGQKIIRNLNDTNEMTRILYKVIHPNGKNGILGRDYHNFEFYNWINYKGVSFSSHLFHSSNPRCYRKNCYIQKTNSEGNLEFYLIDSIMTFFFKTEKQFWLVCKIFKFEGSVCSNALDPILTLTEEKTCFPFDDSIRKMSMFIENGKYYPILC